MRNVDITSTGETPPLTQLVLEEHLTNALSQVDEALLDAKVSTTQNPAFVQASSKATAQVESSASNVTENVKTTVALFRVTCP
ncbi:hypothetical protein VNO78_05168 [Psophocarpus tetragonolobus]|uniref:Uncharacterized protein n=1 Tax=Psophocarpus tetragonolobus TaxID=3891 RepID=A0AAN9XQQ5_PSOTE